jgi:hypothetical protein
LEKVEQEKLKMQNNYQIEMNELKKEFEVTIFVIKYHRKNN